MSKTSKRLREVNQNVKRVFNEMIERNERPGEPRNMKIGPPPEKKNDATE